MGIYIHKPFPKSCNDCPCTDGWNCFADDEFGSVDEHCTKHTKPEWCLLVEVPPHGRLIDADALPINDPINSMMMFGGQIVISKDAIFLDNKYNK